MLKKAFKKLYKMNLYVEFVRRIKEKKSFLSQLGPEPDSWFLTISNEALYFVRPLATTKDREKKNYGPLSNIRFLARRNPQCIKNQWKCAILLGRNHTDIFRLKN